MSIILTHRHFLVYPDGLMLGNFFLQCVQTFAPSRHQNQFAAAFG